MGFYIFSQQTVIISLNNINELIFVTYLGTRCFVFSLELDF
jgi:hypothetical protein